MNKRVVRGLTASAAVAGAALMSVTVAPAPANAGPLPGATKTKAVPGGSVTIKLFDESARVSRAVTNVPTSREVMVSGKIRVTSAGDIKGGAINAGYIVGCQVEFGSDAKSNSITGGISNDAKAPTTLKGGAGIKLAPGQAGYVPIVVSKTEDEITNSFTFSEARGGVVYSNQRFGVDGCAGYAQARAQVTVRVKSPTFVGNITMYGQPFSIG